MNCKLTGCKYIDDYINLVYSGKYKVCKEQYKLCEFVSEVFEKEDVYVDEAQLEKYLSYQKYFPYQLFEWEIFCFALHNCTYNRNGSLRFPLLVVGVGRGAGKNGYLAFEDFCLLTDINGVKEYHIDIFAMSEDQAKQSWNDIYNVLEDNAVKMSKHFKWTKELITNTDTGSELRFRTSNAKTKDGGRPGKVDFDEYHAYENYRLIDVAVTGLGKKRYPRRTIISTDGLVRGGPFDDLKERGMQILNREVADNGTLFFLCKLDADDEVNNSENWNKANPSLQYLPDLQQQLQLEYSDYILNPAANISFMAKRMNLPPAIMENAVTSWENILATNQEIDEDAIYGCPCVAGIDYMTTTDFLGAGLLWRVNGKDYFVSHTWVCLGSADLSRIKAPLREWEARGLLTFVDGKEIPAEIVAVWLQNEANKRNSQLLKIGIDKYRFTLLKKALQEINFSDEKEYDNIELIRPSNEMLMIPSITSGFVNQKFAWGDSPIMRWMCNNSKIETSSAGNMTYGKIEPKSRKTDTFKAFVAAECIADVLDTYSTSAENTLNFGVYTY